MSEKTDAYARQQEPAGKTHTTKYARTQKTEREELHNRYSYHSPKDDQPKRYEAIRTACEELANLIADLTPPSPEQSLAFNALDHVMFLANASIARRD